MIEDKNDQTLPIGLANIDRISKSINIYIETDRELYEGSD